MKKEPVAWITVNHRHIPLYEGESKQDVINRTIAKSNEDKKAEQIAQSEKEADERNGKLEKPKRQVVNGRNIVGFWERRPAEFPFVIDDVIDAQGFNGLPRVVSNKEEFDRCVRESSFIAQRVVSAPDEETLVEYKNQLYNGKWYVDCSTGGCKWGRGMYSMASYDGTITEAVKKEVEDYTNGNESYLSSASGVCFTDVETFTLDKSAKIIHFDDLVKMRKEEIERIKNINPNDVIEGVIFENPKLLSTVKKQISDTVGVDVSIDDVKKILVSKYIQRFGSMSDRLADFDYDNSCKNSFRNFAKQVGYDKAFAGLNWFTKYFQSLTDASLIADLKTSEYAVLKGYDAIRTSAGTCKADTIILNRTKLIFWKG